MKSFSQEQRLHHKLNYIICKQKGINRDYIFDLLKKNPTKYLRYPYLFNMYFGIEECDRLDDLAVGGFLYYMNLLNFDHLFDTRDAGKLGSRMGEMLILGQFLTEESIKLFTDIFPVQSSFWRYWNQHKRSFVDAIKSEKKMTSDNFNWEDYNRIANGKVAFAKAAIDACHLLSRQTNNRIHSALLDAHYDLSVAAQICDDISDVRKDLHDGQFNVALHYYLKDHPPVDTNDADAINELVVQIYRDGVADELFVRAQEHAEQAKERMSGLPKGYFHAVIEHKMMEIREKVKAVKQFFYVQSKQESLAYEAFEGSSKATAETGFSRLNKALDFIMNRIDGDHWAEYITQAGVSTVWSSAFICHQLEDIAPEFPKVAETLQEVRQFIIDARMDQKTLWGYSEQWSLPDADSTNFALLALKDARTIHPALAQALTTFQDSSGGMRTYSQPDILAKLLANEQFENFDGWTQAHPCVSAVTLGVFGRHRNVFGQSVNRLLEYCKKTQKKGAYWQSYWWTDDVYATYFFYTNLRKYFPEETALTANTIDWFVSRQEEDGAIHDSFGPSPFYTGMALNAMLCAPEVPKEAVAKGVKYLMQSQLADGSWESADALLVPAPSRKKTRDHQSWEIRNFGVDIRSPEFQRLFTTSVCTSALFNALKFRKNG